MDNHLATDLLTAICAGTGSPTPTRDPMRVWALSGVERLTFPDASTAIYKYATEPFTAEDQILRAAATAGVPVPEVVGSLVRDGVLGMVIEDLGEPVREARDADGVTAAVALPQPHRPRWCVISTARPWPLCRDWRWATFGACGRAAGGPRTPATSPTCCARWPLPPSRGPRAPASPLGAWRTPSSTPTSLHIGADGWRLLDFARAFNGPGLLDLASWHGTTGDADPDRLRAFVEAYVVAGGSRSALAARGGLAPQAWALGWHRVWAVEWFMEQALRWINDPAQDAAYIAVVRRHLQTAVQLLEP